MDQPINPIIMKTKSLLIALVISITVLNCSKNVKFTQEFKNQTSGKYLFNADDIIEVYYKDNDLFLKWRGGEMESVVTGENEFFIADMYKKLHFVEKPSTQERYLSILQESNIDSITYDYLKVADTYKAPSTYLEEKNYEKALEGFLKIKEQDSTSEFIQQYKFNRIGYKKMAEKEYEDAIAIFEMNTILHPTKHNVYDSLGQAYLVTGDSLRAYTNYKKTLELNSRNNRARDFIEAYEASN